MKEKNLSVNVDIRINTYYDIKYFLYTNNVEGIYSNSYNTDIDN